MGRDGQGSSFGRGTVGNLAGSAGRSLPQVPLRLCPITQRLPEMSETSPRISSWFLL